MSFCVNGSKFGPHQYYRDDEQARRLLRTCRENPVLLTGLRRIGKSWFLRRIEQIFVAGKTRHFSNDGAPSERPIEPELPRKIAILEGGSDGLGAALDAVIAHADPDLVLAVDELEKLVDPPRAHLLDRILAYRPLVLSAAPVIHEIARDRAPILATFFEERCVPMVLRPLSRGEKRALALQTCDAGEGVPEDAASMALWWDWGGHPLVLQQIGILLRDRHASDAQMLTNLAHARLNLGGPRYGVSLAGENGLSRPQRTVLARVAAGQPPGDEHPAVELQDHGAIVQRKGKWAIENCVLRRHLQGASEASAEAESPRPAPVVPRSKPASPIRVFTWIHLSDLHFGAGNRERHFDRRKVTKAIARDIREHAPKAVDRIFVTGDIAFSAKPKEYDEATRWFVEVSQAAGVPKDQLRLVPGNHDVDRQLAKKPLTTAVHRAVRKGLVDLDDLLADTDAQPVLAAKLGAYKTFVEKGFSGHPPALKDNGIDWVESIPATASVRGPLRVAGLSTVWISDDEDGNREDPFVPNMALAQGPIEDTVRLPDPSEFLLLLTHHPPHWLAGAGARALEGALARPAHVHLCGHVHAATASAEKRLGRAGRSLRWVAGAAHGDKGEEYGYAWGALRYDPAKEEWRAGWAPRTYEPSRDEMRADSMRHDLEPDGFAWEPIDCPWLAPAG